MTSATVEATTSLGARARRLARNVRVCTVLAILLCACAVTVLAFSFATLFLAKEFARRWVVRPYCKALLLLVGVRVRDLRPPGPDVPTIYISNHLSMLDIFVVCSLGLPRTRYFLSVSTLRVWPMAIVGRCTGVFYIAEQSDPEARADCFRRAERVLRETGESVYLSPEGFRNPGRELQKFNRGAFHLATNLGYPVVSLLLDPSEGCNPGLGLFFRPGTVTVKRIGVADTTGWKLADVDAHRDAVRANYVAAMAAGSDGA